MPQEGVVSEPGGQAHKSAKMEQTPKHNPDPLYCSYYVSRKHRFCRTECKSGSLYCCTHDGTPASNNDGAKLKARRDDGADTSLDDGDAHPDGKRGREDDCASRDVRVPCPINPNHTVYAARLEKHVRVCPDLRFVTNQLPYFSDNKHANQGAAFVQSASAENTEKGSARRTHRDLSPESPAALILKVSECYRTCVAPEIVVMHSCTTSTTNTSSTEAGAVKVAVGEGVDASSSKTASSAPLAHSESSSQKHGPQHTALLRCLSDVILQSHSEESILTQYAALQPGSAAPQHKLSETQKPIHIDGFLEFGAGKGGLTVALQQLIVQHLSASDLTADGAVPIKEESACTRAEAVSASTPSAASPSWAFLQEVAAQPPLIVLDMDGFRRKGDARVRHSAVPLRRLRINIKDVNLTQAFLTDIHQLPPSSSSSSSIQGKGEKRGASSAAADGESLQGWAVLGKHLCGACTDFALSCLTEGPSLAQEARVRLPVAVIATCCHHRCELIHLNPPEALHPEKTGDAVLRMPGSALTWSPEEFAALASMSSWAVCGGFVDETRRLVGWQCKRILDQLRVHFLRRLGYVAFQCQYTTRDVTEENICLIAFQKSI